MRRLGAMLGGGMVGYALMGTLAAAIVHFDGTGRQIALWGGLVVLLCIALMAWLGGRGGRPSGSVSATTRVLGAVLGSFVFLQVGVAVMLVLQGLELITFPAGLSGFQAWLENLALGGGIGMAVGVPMGAVLAGH